MTTTDRILLGIIARFLIFAALCGESWGDDTAAINAALANADSFGQVVLAPGTYTVGPLTIPGNVRYIFGSLHSPTTLRLKANAGQASRILHVKHSGEADRSITIGHLSFDMNAGEQGEISNDRTGQQGAIFLEGDKQRGGRLIASLHDIHAWDGAGDFVYAYHAAMVEVVRFRGTRTFRSGIAITGKNASLFAHHSRFVECGIDVEPNSPGDKVDVTLADIVCSKFDIALNVPGCKATCERITCDGLLYLYCHPQSEFVCLDSDFMGRYKIRLAGQSTFANCRFNAPAGNASPVISVQWVHNSLSKNQNLTFRNCKINGPGSLGIFVSEDVPANNNQFSLIDSTITGTDAGAEAPKTASGRQKRGNWVIENSFHNGNPIK